MIKKILFSYLIPFLLIHANADESQFWTTFNTSQFEINESLKSKSHVELRFPEAEYMSYFRVSQKFSWKLAKKWTVGTHPTVEGSRSRGASDWKNTYRIDLELNPAKFTLGDNGPTISMRNRWEIRWKEGKGSEVFNRLRQYTKVTWKTGDDFLKSYTLANEIFYEEDKSKFTLNRFYPVVVGLSIFDDISTSFYYMYQSKRVGLTDDWKTTHVFGTSVNF